MEPLLRGHPVRDHHFWKGHLTLYLTTNVLIFTPEERPPLLKGHFSGAKRVVLQEGFHCTLNIKLTYPVIREFTTIFLYIKIILFFQSVNNYFIFNSSIVHLIFHIPYNIEYSYRICDIFTWFFHDAIIF